MNSPFYPTFEMHQQSNRQLQERTTSLSVSDVLEAATRFFTRRNGVYTAFVEKEGPTHVVLRGQGGQEVVIGAQVTGAGTRVSGSSYLFDAQIARFLDALPLAPVVTDSRAADASGEDIVAEVA